MIDSNSEHIPHHYVIYSDGVAHHKIDGSIIEGLVKKIRRRGSFVFDITVKDIEQIAEVRYLLEEFALKKSILSIIKNGFLINYI